MTTEGVPGQRTLWAHHGRSFRAFGAREWLVQEGAADQEKAWTESGEGAPCRSLEALGWETGLGCVMEGGGEWTGV